jgi:cystathionine beta-lyase
MTLATVPPETREKRWITDGLVRFTVGIADVAELIEDLDKALS